MKELTIQPLLDEHGHLESSHEWNETLAQWFAEQEHIQLTAAHWEVIYFFRQFYAEHHAIPATRLLVQAIAKVLGKEKGNSIYLQQLFPVSLPRQASRIAGLPKPARCM